MLDELDKVEMYLSQGLQLSDWLDIRVDEPALQKNGEILWHLRKTLSTLGQNGPKIGHQDVRNFDYFSTTLIVVNILTAKLTSNVKL